MLEHTREFSVCPLALLRQPQISRGAAAAAARRYRRPPLPATATIVLLLLPAPAAVPHAYLIIGWSHIRLVRVLESVVARIIASFPLHRCDNRRRLATMPNIFFNEESLVLAFPLIALCSIYVSIMRR